MTLALIALYLAALVAIGLASTRFGQGTGEDFFLASRSLGPWVLLASLVGTHMTSFSILGASGEAYHRGIGVFGLMASSSALVVPLLFLTVGTRLWALGKRHGYLTQTELIRDRWGSDALGLAVFLALSALLVPYLLISVKGAGLTLAEASGGRISAGWGGLLVGGVVIVYVAAGGMRGTAWVNAFQTVIFLVLGALAFGAVVAKLGGLTAILERAASEHPELLRQEPAIPPLEHFSYLVIPLSAAMFPHLSAQWLTARKASTFRLSVVLYPLCVALVWLPSVLLGVIGRLEVPGLAGPASSGVVAQLIERLLAPGLAAVLVAGLFAAVAASLDSQALALTNMFTRDIVRHYGFGDRLSEQRQVLFGRLFVALLVLGAVAIAPRVDRSLFKLGVLCFTGFVGLFPVLLAALFWRRSTWQGGLAAVVVTALGWSWYATRAMADPGYTVGGTGLLPAAPLLLASALALAVVSWLTPPPDPARLARFFPEDAR
ncbi:MAG TPA: sodium:solute symporter family protein [Thermoanaerobaculia bacterium]|nr:sodium:solute symporter family protein [Thermoanaerobaculia bacterium]